MDCDSRMRAETERRKCIEFRLEHRSDIECKAFAEGFRCAPAAPSNGTESILREILCEIGMVSVVGEVEGGMGGRGIPGEKTLAQPEPLQAEEVEGIRSGEVEVQLAGVSLVRAEDVVAEIEGTARGREKAGEVSRDVLVRMVLDAGKGKSVVRYGIRFGQVEKQGSDTADSGLRSR